MPTEDKLTLHDAHLKFAKEANGKAWQLLEKPERSPAEDDELLEAVYASNYHWRSVGTAVNAQRGEWMLAHVYSVLREVKPALKHARRCLDLTAELKDQMDDFDIAYGYEGMARALALAGQQDEARKYKALAQAAGEAILDPEDKEIFMTDLLSGEWYGA